METLGHDAEQSPWKELSNRAGDGRETRLLWREEDGQLKVVVHNITAGEVFEVPAQPDNALDVFEHPFAYIGE